MIFEGERIGHVRVFYYTCDPRAIRRAFGEREGERDDGREIDITGAGI